MQDAEFYVHLRIEKPRSERHRKARREDDQSALEIVAGKGAGNTADDDKKQRKEYLQPVNNGIVQKSVGQDRCRYKIVSEMVDHHQQDGKAAQRVNDRDASDRLLRH